MLWYMCGARIIAIIRNPLPKYCQQRWLLLVRHCYELSWWVGTRDSCWCEDLQPHAVMYQNIPIFTCTSHMKRWNKNTWADIFKRGAWALVRRQKTFIFLFQCVELYVCSWGSTSRAVYKCTRRYSYFLMVLIFISCFVIHFKRYNFLHHHYRW